MTLEEAIAAFKKTPEAKRWRRPREAHGDCGAATWRFIQFLKYHFVKEARWAKELHYRACTSRHYPINVKFLTIKENDSILREALRPCGGWTEHVVVKIGRLRIDWTARQFDPKSPFPLIWSVKS